MRKVEESKQITEIARNDSLPLQVMQLDVNNDESVIDAVNTVVDEKKRIDVAVNNAGYALTGPFEETSMEETKHSLKPISLER